MEDNKEYITEEFAGTFRGVASIVKAYLPTFKAGISMLGQARPLAFASEVGVAAKSLLPRIIYLSSWGLSGAAVTVIYTMPILADIATKTWNSADELKCATVFYYIAFHIPASLVLPAVLIHKIVDYTRHKVNTNTRFSNIPIKTKKFIPVLVALVSIIPIVPIIDHSTELILEPTLGKLLGLPFNHSSAINKKEL